MIYRSFTILLLFSLCSLVAYSQGGGGTKKDSSSPVQEIERKKFIKEQAILLLKNHLLNSKSIDNLPQRADVVAEASAILWDYDQPFARESLLDFINRLLADYKELLLKENKTKEEYSTLRNLDYALRKSLKALAGKDVGKANLLQRDFFEIKQQSLKNPGLK